MRNCFRTACLSLAILSCGGVLSAARHAQAAEPPVGAAEAIAPQRAFVRLWQTPSPFEDVKFATVIGNSLYVAGTLRGLTAVDVATGVPRWTHLGPMPLDYPPTELGKVLYILEGGQLVTLNEETGVELSRGNSSAGYLTPLYPGEDHCIVGSGDKLGHVYSIESKTGVRLQRFTLDDFPVSSTWNGSTDAYILTAKGTLYRVSIRTQEIVWQHKFPNEFCSAPAYTEKSIYVGCADFYLYALSPVTGSIQWRTDLSSPVIGCPLIAGQRIYAATSDGLIHAVDIKTHSELWTLAAKRVLTTTPEHVLFLGENEAGNWIGMADAATGKVISQASASEYTLFAGAPEGAVVYATGKKCDILALGDGAAILARQAAEEARRASAAGDLIPEPAVPPPSAAPAPRP